MSEGEGEGRKEKGVGVGGKEGEGVGVGGEGGGRQLRMKWVIPSPIGHQLAMLDNARGKRRWHLHS